LIFISPRSSQGKSSIKMKLIFVTIFFMLCAFGSSQAATQDQHSDNNNNKRSLLRTVLSNHNIMEIPDEVVASRAADPAVYSWDDDWDD